MEHCVFNPVLAGKQPAMTFVMGHTHEPMMQEVSIIEYVPAKPPTTPDPGYVPPPPEAKGHKVQVTVNFLQVDVIRAGTKAWSMIATVESRNWHTYGVVSESGSAGPRQDIDLFDTRPVHDNDCIKLLPGQGVSFPIPVDDGLIISANVGGPDADPEGVRIDVSAFTWGGVRTIEREAENGGKRGYKLTFELQWGELLP